MRNYYELLNVQVTANGKDLKKAYHKMLKIYHPDVFKGNKKISEDLVAQLNLAYETLSSSEKRLEYDKKIFPSFKWNYFYDDEGNRVSLEINKPKKRSFFSVEKNKKNANKKSLSDMERGRKKLDFFILLLSFILILLVILIVFLNIFN